MQKPPLLWMLLGSPACLRSFCAARRNASTVPSTSSVMVHGEETRDGVIRLEMETLFRKYGTFARGLQVWRAIEVVRDIWKSSGPALPSKRERWAPKACW